MMDVGIPLHGRPLAAGEFFFLMSVLVVELAVAVLLGIDFYNTSAKLAQLILMVVEIGVGLGSFWVMLSLFGVQSSVRLPGALWALLIWFGLFLSHIAYVGYLFIPVEIAVAAAALRFRVGLAPGLTLLAAFVGRIVMLAVLLASRSSVIRYIAS